MKKYLALVLTVSIMSGAVVANTPEVKEAAKVLNVSENDFADMVADTAFSQVAEDGFLNRHGEALVAGAATAVVTGAAVWGGMHYNKKKTVEAEKSKNPVIRATRALAEAATKAEADFAKAKGIQEAFAKETEEANAIEEEEVRNTAIEAAKTKRTESLVKAFGENWETELNLNLADVDLTDAETVAEVEKAFVHGRIDAENTRVQAEIITDEVTKVVEKYLEDLKTEKVAEEAIDSVESTESIEEATDSTETI
jgi:hypothetical protein